MTRFSASAMLAATAFAIALPCHAHDVALRIESGIPAGHATRKSMEVFKDEVVRLSAGAMAVEVKSGSQRPLKELIDGVHVGHIFATWVSVGYFSRLVPEIAALSLPFAFEDYDGAKRAVAGRSGQLSRESSRRRDSLCSPGWIWARSTFQTRNGQ